MSAVRQRFTPLSPDTQFHTPRSDLRGRSNHSISKRDAPIKRSNARCNEQGPSLMACKIPHYSNTQGTDAPLHLRFPPNMPLDADYKNDCVALPLHPQNIGQFVGEKLDLVARRTCGTISGRFIIEMCLQKTIHSGLLVSKRLATRGIWRSWNPGTFGPMCLGLDECITCAWLDY